MRITVNGWAVRRLLRRQSEVAKASQQAASGDSEEPLSHAAVDDRTGGYGVKEQRKVFADELAAHRGTRRLLCRAPVELRQRQRVAAALGSVAIGRTR